MFFKVPEKYSRTTDLTTMPIHITLLIAVKKIKLEQFKLRRDMRVPTMWNVRPAKHGISLRIHTA